MKILEPYEINDATLDSSNVVETVPEYDAGATYDEGDRVRDDTTHHVYESLIDSNTGNALDDVDSWLDLGPTNRWAMFDRKIGTVTENAEAIEVTFSVAGRVTGIALFGVSGASVQVTVVDDTDGTVFDETFSLVSQDNVNDFYDYFFAPILRRTNYFIYGLPLYSGAQVTVRIENPDGVAKVGILVPGRVVEFGRTTMGAGFGIIDYSVKEADADFGTVDLVERNYRATGSFRDILDPYLSDEVGRVLTERRAQPTVFVGDERYSSLLVYGFARDWEITKEEGGDVLEIQIEGL